jgi:hypothetical protein
MRPSILSRPLVQVCYTVPDTRAAALEWVERTGAGPFFCMDHFSIDVATHRGEPAVWDHSAAFGQWGDIQLELIAQHRAEPATMAEALNFGEYKLQHLTWFTDDVGAESARLEAMGWPRVIDARLASGTHFAFHDARDPLGHLIEIYSPTPQVRAHYQAVAAAAVNWDGTDPVRDFNLRPLTRGSN